MLPNKNIQYISNTLTELLDWDIYSLLYYWSFLKLKTTSIKKNIRLNFKI